MATTDHTPEKIENVCNNPDQYQHEELDPRVKVCS